MPWLVSHLLNCVVVSVWLFYAIQKMTYVCVCFVRSHCTRTKPNRKQLILKLSLSQSWVLFLA